MKVHHFYAVHALLAIHWCVKCAGYEDVLNEKDEDAVNDQGCPVNYYYHTIENMCFPCPCNMHTKVIQILQGKHLFTFDKATIPPPVKRKLSTTSQVMAALLSLGKDKGHREEVSCISFSRILRSSILNFKLNFFF